MNPDLLFAEAFRLQQRGALLEAEAAYRQLLALRPAHSDGRLNLGAVLAAAGRPLEAATEFQEVVRQNPRDARGWANLGVARRKAGKRAFAAGSGPTSGVRGMPVSCSNCCRHDGQKHPSSWTYVMSNQRPSTGYLPARSVIMPMIRSRYGLFMHSWW